MATQKRVFPVPTNSLPASMIEEKSFFKSLTHLCNLIKLEPSLKLVED
jgi:hypothetical protein